jgi:hypothetical protein
VAACATRCVGASSKAQEKIKGSATMTALSRRAFVALAGSAAAGAIMDLVEGPVTFVDTRNNKRDGKLQLKPVQTVINGVPFGRPYQSPFSVR